MRLTGKTRRLLNATLYEREDGLWEDAKGTIYALTDPKLSVDTNNQAGVGIFVLPKGHFLSQAAPMHDYMFSSPAFQRYHSLAEANLWFLRNAAILGNGKRGARLWLGVARFALGRFSRYFWDNPDTAR